MSERGRPLPVKPGGDKNVCLLCGIYREFAGFIKETCGNSYLEPDCFVLFAGREAEATVNS